MNILFKYKSKKIGIYCDSVKLLEVVYTIKEKIGCKVIQTTISKGYSKLDIIAENCNNYLIIDVSSSIESLRGLKFDEIWYCFSEKNKEDYLEKIFAYNCNLNYENFKDYEDI